MSLFSLLNSTTTSTSLTYGGSTATTSAALATQKLLATQAAGATTSTTAATGTADSGVTISAAAQEAADNAKDFAALGKEVRATLDAQYKAAGSDDPTAASPQLAGFSGRALAAIALNQDKSFSATEVRAAKQALRSDMQASIAGAIGGSGVTVSGLASYSQQLVSDYDAMSPEERQARGWTDGFRASNAAFVDKASQPNLFDLLNG